MNPQKKNIELTGSLIYPIEVGEAAFIREADGMRMTSTVLRTEKISAQEICFETVNTSSSLTVIYLRRQRKMFFAFSTWNIRTDTEAAL